MVRFTFLFLVSLVTLAGCSSDDASATADAGVDAPIEGGQDAGDIDAGDAVSESDAPKVISYSLSFVRDDSPSLPGFVAELSAEYEDGSPASPSGVDITCDRGAPSTDVETQEGRFTRAFEPDVTGTGEYRVTATVGGEAVATATALVMESVGAKWGQPRKVEGLVNTDGWEDGANITEDGEWLFIHYLPITPSCLWQSPPDPTSPECSHARGPVTAPERPNMPGADRVASDGTITHGCPSIGIPSLPIPLPPNTLFGFKRQEDGSFAEPFYVAFDGIDGCASPFGITFVRGQTGSRTMLFAYDDPFDNDPPNVDSGGDIFALSDVQLGDPIVLGRYSLSGGEVVLDDFAGVLLASTVDGHFGNPGGFQDASGRVQVWYDDESVSEDQRDLGAIVFAPGEFPSETSTAPQPLPPPFAVPGVAEIQPFFDGTEALFRQGWDIAYATYAGGDIFDPASWSPAELIVESDSTAFATQKAGAIVTTGEPTKAVVGGATEVYFVYGVMLADGSVDLNVGVITER